MKRENELMADFDPDKYIGNYCKRKHCAACFGTDDNGEPFGFGCLGLEERQERMYQSILKRRLKKPLRERREEVSNDHKTHALHHRGLQKAIF